MPTTVEQCWKYYTENHLNHTCSPHHAVIMYRNAVKDFAHMDPETMMPADVQKWSDRQARRGRGPATIQRYLKALNACLKYNHKHGRITRCPYIPMPASPPTKVRALTREQCALLIQTADKSPNWRKQVFVRLALGTGARPGAICELRWDQVNMKDGLIDFRSNSNLSNRMKKRAVVPINEMVTKALSIARMNAKGDYVLHRWGRGIKSPADMMEELSRDTGIKRLTAHVLRHTVASLLLQDHKNLLQVSKLLGHSNTQITEQVYFQHPPEWLKELTDELKF